MKCSIRINGLQGAWKWNLPLTALLGNYDSRTNQNQPTTDRPMDGYMGSFKSFNSKHIDSQPRLFVSRRKEIVGRKQDIEYLIKCIRKLYNTEYV